MLIEISKKDPENKTVLLLINYLTDMYNIKPVVVIS